MSNTEIDFKVVVPVYSKEYQELKQYTVGELPEVFRYVRSVRSEGDYIVIVYGKTKETLEKAIIQKQHILSYHYYLSGKEFDAAISKEKRKTNE